MNDNLQAIVDVLNSAQIVKANYPQVISDVRLVEEATVDVTHVVFDIDFFGDRTLRIDFSVRDITAQNPPASPFASLD